MRTVDAVVVIDHHCVACDPRLRVLARGAQRVRSPTRIIPIATCIVIVDGAAGVGARDRRER